MAFDMSALKAHYGDRIYTDSVNEVQNGCVLMVNLGAHDAIVAAGVPGFHGAAVESWLECPLDHENAETLRKLFPFAAPQRILGRDKTMGVGDRLGICTPGHIRAFRAYPQITPVFAQQSIRELTLTNRTFDDVLDCASFAVYREGFKTGFGADGDHLKTASEVEYALSRHYTMITLDCSEHIHGEINDENCDALYTSMPELEAIYLDRSFDIGEGCTVHFDAHEFHKTALIYAEAVQFAAKIYHDLIESPEGDRADFEMSIDETATPTTPAQHFFVANEFKRLGVHTCTVAPRFCGEFQKGIDYKGDLKQFEAELKVHAAIARHFGYKLSIHSGSDKFSVFPYIGRETQGRFHLKTAGTNWLQAMLLIADCKPELYREVHAYALTVFNEATKYYHVTTDLNRIPALDSLTDAQLPELFKNEDSRQLIHITYGLILNAKDEGGKFRFRDRLFEAWRAHEETLSAHVATHIERHMKLILGEEV